MATVEGVESWVAPEATTEDPEFILVPEGSDVDVELTEINVVELFEFHNELYSHCFHATSRECLLGKNGDVSYLKIGVIEG